MPTERPGKLIILPDFARIPALTVIAVVESGKVIARVDSGKIDAIVEITKEEET